MRQSAGHVYGEGDAGMSNGNLKSWYATFPEWLRWVLCWPISLVGAVGLWLIFALVLNYTAKAPQFVIRLLHPIFVQVLFLGLLHETLPRAKFGILLTCVILRSLFLLLYLGALACMILAYFGVIGGVAQPFEPVNATWVYEFLGEIGVVAASIGVLAYLRSPAP